jgi:hypothetical protein
VTLFAGLGFNFLPLGRAHADTVLFDSSGFIRGTQAFTDTFNLTAPGTLTVTLTNVAWPAQLASLNFLLSSDQGVMGKEVGSGKYSFDIKTGGNVFAQWFGTAQGPLNAGVYSLRIDFHPLGETAVPIPPSLLLLGSGLVFLWFRLRQQKRWVAGALRPI